MESSQWIVSIYVVLLGILVLGVISILGVALLTEPREDRRPTAMRYKRKYGPLISKVLDDLALGTLIDYVEDTLRGIDEKNQSEVEPIELVVPRESVANSTEDGDFFDLFD